MDTLNRLRFKDLFQSMGAHAACGITHQLLSSHLDISFKWLHPIVKGAQTSLECRTTSLGRARSANDISKFVIFRVNDLLIPKIAPTDTELIDLIAEWYQREWKIEKEITRKRLTSLPLSGIPFHLILFVDGRPIGTGGIHHDVRLITVEPRFKKYDPWLALIYILPEFRNKKYGAILCEKIQSMSKEMGLKEIFLYTVTAESLYKRLGWQVIERIDYVEKDCPVMMLKLDNG